jgi:hypothetical protein
MYDHPDCVFTDLEAVPRYVAGRAIEIVEGDIVQTAARLATEDVVLAFIDTDNYSSARAALHVVAERTLLRRRDRLRPFHRSRQVPVHPGRADRRASAPRRHPVLPPSWHRGVLSSTLIVP